MDVKDVKVIYDDTTYIFRISENTTVGKLKEAIESGINIPKSDQVLTYRPESGEVDMKDEPTLYVYSYPDTIYLKRQMSSGLQHRLSMGPMSERELYAMYPDPNEEYYYKYEYKIEPVLDHQREAFNEYESELKKMSGKQKVYYRHEYNRGGRQFTLQRSNAADGVVALDVELVEGQKRPPRTFLCRNRDKLHMMRNLFYTQTGDYILQTLFPKLNESTGKYTYEINKALPHQNDAYIEYIKQLLLAWQEGSDAPLHTLDFNEDLRVFSLQLSDSDKEVVVLKTGLVMGGEPLHTYLSTNISKLKTIMAQKNQQGGGKRKSKRKYKRKNTRRKIKRKTRKHTRRTRKHTRRTRKHTRRTRKNKRS